MAVGLFEIGHNEGFVIALLRNQAGESKKLNPKVPDYVDEVVRRTCPKQLLYPNKTSDPGF